MDGTSRNSERLLCHTFQTQSRDILNSVFKAKEEMVHIKNHNKTATTAKQ